MASSSAASYQDGENSETGDDRKTLEYVNNLLVAACIEVEKPAGFNVRGIRFSWGPQTRNIKPFLDVLRNTQKSGTSTPEITTTTEDIPIPPSELANRMMSPSEWSALLFPWVNNAVYLPREIPLARLKEIDDTIEGVVRMHAEFLLPTPLVPLRSYEFVRCRRRIAECSYAVFDISSTFFGDEIISSNSLRRPSGLLIRPGRIGSKVIVVENVVVDDPEKNVYRTLVKNSRLAFSAYEWAKIVLWKCKRDTSTFHYTQHTRDQRVVDVLLGVTRAMKSCFMQSIRDEQIMPTSDKVIKIKPSHLFDHVGFMSAKVKKASPANIVDYLMKKDLQLKLPGNHNLMFKFVGKDEANIISLYSSEASGSKLYYLQEVSRGDCYSFVLSALISDDRMDFSPEILEKLLHDMAPTGFAILPDDPRRIDYHASIVTILRPPTEGNRLEQGESSRTRTNPETG